MKPEVAIVGSGFAGIAAGVKLRKAGIESFTIYEKSLDIGGTWRDNTYPGCEVDTPSSLYSFSFTIPEWSRTHARQAELRKYLETVVDEFGLRPHIRTGTGVDAAVWDEQTHSYSLRLDDGSFAACDVLISAVGFLNVPRMPTWPGLANFRGPAFHTARWEHEHDLTGKRVAVVGTGSSAIQIVPEIAKVADRVLLFQREPGWIMPKGERDYTSEEREALRNPLRWRRARLQQLRRVERNLGGRMAGAAALRIRAPAHHHRSILGVDHSSAFSRELRLRRALVEAHVADSTATGLLGPLNERVADSSAPAGTAVRTGPGPKSIRRPSSSAGPTSTSSSPTGRPSRRRSRRRTPTGGSE